MKLDLKLSPRQQAFVELDAGVAYEVLFGGAPWRQDKPLEGRWQRGE